MVKSANDIAMVLAEGVSRLGREIRRRNEQRQQEPRHDPVELGQSERPAGGGPDHLGARPRHPGARAAARFSGIRHVLAYSGDQVRQAGDAQLQHADRPLRRRRRHEDRLHLRLRLQSRGLGHAQRQAADRGRARLALVAVSRAKAAGLLERGFNRGALAWLTPSLGTVDALQPINAAPPDLRDEMCGPHRKRPAAEEADDESTTATGSDAPKSFMLSSLPPSSGKPSAPGQARPAAATPIVVFAGPGEEPGRNPVRRRAPSSKSPRPASSTRLRLAALAHPHVAPLPSARIATAPRPP